MHSPIQQLLDNTADYRPIAAASLKAANLPVVIYGAGLMARGISSVLDNNSVTNYVYAVDEQYLDSTALSPKQVDERFDRYMLVHGHSRGYTHAIPPQFKNAAGYRLIMGDKEMGVIESDFLTLNLEKFEETYNWLEDTLSQDSMLAYLSGKLTHNAEPMLPFITHEDYFIDSIFAFKAGASYIDCGAFDGDTILRFAEKYGDYGHIVGFEPDKKNFDALTKKVAMLLNVTAVCKGTSDEYATITFAENAANPMQSNISDTGNTTIEVDKIDNYTANIPPVGLIKMDIEGAELKALKGAADTIRRDKPVLAICAYHKADDLITIPQYIKSLAPEYKLYLRYNEETPMTLYELVLYAVCDKDASQHIESK